MLIDFLPLIAFFVAYKLAGLYTATAILIAALTLQSLWQWWQRGQIDYTLLTTWVVTLILGSATLLLHDSSLIKMKPTVIYWILSLVFWLTPYFNKPYLAKQWLGGQLALPDEAWQKINVSLVMLFGWLGALNWYIAVHYNTDTWVNFKIFGILTITGLYFVGLSWYLTRHGQKTTT